MRTILARLLLVTDDGEAGRVWAEVLGSHDLATTVVQSDADLPDQWEESGFCLAIIGAGNRRNVLR